MTQIEQGKNEIVVAQDGSPAALAAADIAIQIARSQDLSVHGLCVVDETLALDTYADYRRELESNGETTSWAELLTWFEEQGDAAFQMVEVRCQAAGAPVTAELLAGGVPEMVLRESEQARLLATGRRGHGHGGDPDHLGRSFRAIAHHAHVPLVIRGGGREANSATSAASVRQQQRHPVCLGLGILAAAHATGRSGGSSRERKRAPINQ